jgi:hypothetical protein
MTLRESLDALREGPVLVADLPGDEVDVERLVSHLVAHGFSGGVHLADRDTESLLWISDGAPRDVWFFESGGSEAALSGVLGHDVFHQMAARGGTVSVLISEPPRPVAMPPTPVLDPPPISETIQGPAPVPQSVAAPEPAKAAPTPVREPQRVEEVPDRAAAASPRVEPSIPEPPSHPWAAILEDVAERVARHRGPKLAARFTAALDAALAAHGGRLEGGRVVAPELSESTWRIVVEAACAPITAVAGRAFVDRTIAAADREVRVLQAGMSGLR